MGKDRGYSYSLGGGILTLEPDATVGARPRLVSDDVLLQLGKVEPAVVVAVAVNGRLDHLAYLLGLETLHSILLEDRLALRLRSHTLFLFGQTHSRLVVVVVLVVCRKANVK